MVHKRRSLCGITIPLLTPGPAHIIHAVTLMMLVAAMAAPAHSENVAQRTQQSSAEANLVRANIHPVAVTDYVDLENAGRAFNVLVNDSDADNDTLMITTATARYGAVVFTAEGLVAYAANPAQPRADEINYIVSDGRGGFVNGKVIVAVR